MKRAIQLLCTLATVALLFPVASVSASQTNAVDIRVWTETADGQPVVDVCYQLVGYSNVGCDENLDGNVYFEAIPYGNYELVAMYSPDTGYNIHPMEIVVDANNTDFLVIVDAPALQPDSTDVHLITRSPDTGESHTEVCYELVGYSNIGCDENNDGHVTFAEIPYGEYIIRQTSTPYGYPPMEDYAVSVMPTSVDGPFTLLLSQTEEQAPPDHVNVAVIFYDVNTGQPVLDEENCAQLRHGQDPVSNIGCDEDVIDGQVDFMHVAFDANDSNYRLRVDVACPYGMIPGSEYDHHWIGEHTLGIYVPVSRDVAIGCQ